MYIKKSKHAENYLLPLAVRVVGFSVVQMGVSLDNLCVYKTMKVKLAMKLKQVLRLIISTT
jgi:hypothetical protein